MTSKDLDTFVQSIAYSATFNTVLFAAMTMRSDPDMLAGRALLAHGFPLALATSVLGGCLLLSVVFGLEVYAQHDAKKESTDAR